MTSLWACGSNSLGALGLGDLEDRAEFTQITFPHREARCLQVATKGQHALALVQDPLLPHSTHPALRVYTWGLEPPLMNTPDKHPDSIPNLGAHESKRTAPYEVDMSGNRIRHVTCGWDVSFVIDETGTLWSWDATTASTPSGQTIARQPLGRSCVCMSRGLAACECRRVPRPIYILDRTEVLEVSAGWRHAVCIVRVPSRGGVYLYGWGCNRNNQLGDFLSCDASEVAALSSPRDRERGQRSDGRTAPDFFVSPVELRTMTNVEEARLRDRVWIPTRVSCGWRHTLVLFESRDGDDRSTLIYGYGRRSHADWGMFGYQPNASSWSTGPVALFDASDTALVAHGDQAEPGAGTGEQETKSIHPSEWIISDISSGNFHAAALLTHRLLGSTRAMTWGRCDLGQVGRPVARKKSDSIALPAFVPNLSPSRVVCGSDHVLALQRQSNGVSEVWSWGWNEHGNLGYTSQEETKQIHSRRVFLACPSGVTVHEGDEGDSQKDTPKPKAVQGRVQDVVAGGAVSFVLVSEERR